MNLLRCRSSLGLTSPTSRVSDEPVDSTSSLEALSALLFSPRDVTEAGIVGTWISVVVRIGAAKAAKNDCCCRSVTPLTEFNNSTVPGVQYFSSEHMQRPSLL